MQKDFPIFFLLLLVSSLFGQENQIIQDIRKEYDDIKNILTDLSKDSVVIDGLSTEGSQINIYKDKNSSTRLIFADHFGEMGKKHEEYYFKNDTLIFKFSELQQYNVPFFMTGQTAEELGSEPYDPDKTKIFEDRFYFFNKKLFRWLDDNKNEISKQDKRFKEKEKEIFDFLKRINEKVNQTEPQ
ncbi:hypothetical protein JW935_04265 [candidate division KSB1 bacterium]|nr:hypothetical protein [candidate division KSB1 bacterium]